MGVSIAEMVSIQSRADNFPQGDFFSLCAQQRCVTRLRMLAGTRETVDRGELPARGPSGEFGFCHPFHLQAALNSPAWPGVAVGEGPWRAAAGLHCREGTQPSPQGDAALHLSTLCGTGCPEHRAEASVGSPEGGQLPFWEPGCRDFFLNKLTLYLLPPYFGPATNHQILQSHLPTPCQLPDGVRQLGQSHPPVFPALCSVSHLPAGVYPQTLSSVTVASTPESSGRVPGLEQTRYLLQKAGWLHKLLHC